jgi:hypothetical protein
MKRTSYFVVRPNERLLQFAQENDAPRFGDSRVFTIETGGRRLLPPDADEAWQLGRLKLYYLADAIYRFEIHEDDPRHRYSALTKQLFGPAPYSTTVFDRWWIIEYCGSSVVDIDKGEHCVDHATWKLFDPTQENDLIAEWIESLVSESAKQETEEPHP